MNGTSPLLLLCLLFLQALCLSGQEKSIGDEVARMIRDADDVRVVHEDLGDIKSDAPTAYQCILPEGNQALARTFADATLALFRDNNGNNDPGEGISSSYMIINVRKEGALAGIIAVCGHLVHVIKPGKLWYDASYKDDPWWDNNASIETSLIERRALGVIRASVSQGGGWKKVEGDLKGFLHIDPSR